MKYKFEAGMNIDDVMKGNENNCRYFFSPSTMRGFNSRICGDMQGKYFISSEKNTGILSGTNYPRLYTVREVSEDFGIKTVGKFQEYSSISAAKTAIKHLLRG